VPSKHKNVSLFLRQEFFKGLKSFKDFEDKTEALSNTTEVGDAFEILVEGYLLKIDKVLGAKDVWIVKDIPEDIRQKLNLPKDSKGIDGVFEDIDGKPIPYQVKYRTDKDTLSFTEASPFLGVTEESLDIRYIFTNARNLATDIENRKGVCSVRADKFHELTKDDFDRIYAWLTDIPLAPKEKHSPKPHQAEAIRQITNELSQANRTTAVMACGTGKTFVALWAAEEQNPHTVLVLLPSLALLSQTLPDWCEQNKWGDKFRYLCVCSDSSVDKSAQNDDYALKQTDLDFSVTTDPKRVNDFLAKNASGVNVIFSTYQSIEVVKEGLNGKSIDLGIFDEAHKTTGPKGGLFALGLNDKYIQIKKRLFLTATPRHYNLRKRDKDGDFQTISMNDTAVYGKVSYRLSFSAAVEKKIIVPYKIIISVSLNGEVDDQLLRLGKTLVKHEQIQARWVANQIALKRAVEKTSASKIITFHSRVKLAEDFQSSEARGITGHLKDFEVFHVNGKQKASDRKSILNRFKKTSKGLITNARCLTEGVDVPAVDMVAFIDPRTSKIDIAQAAGRAMRLSPSTNKTIGYIVVPLFIEQKRGETETEALKRTGFSEVAEVLISMLENDDDLIDIIKELKQARGRGDTFNPNALHEKIQVIGPTIDLENLTKSIDIQILDRLGFNWDENYGLLQKYFKREGHCNVTQYHKENGFSLGTWVVNQRLNREKLSPERIRLLDSLNFSWDPLTEWWNEAFAALKEFHKREGHCSVPRNHKENGINLSSWVKTQRLNKEKLSPERIRLLDSLNFSWDPFTELWNEAFAGLKEFHKREGHCDVPRKHKENGVNLGLWVKTQRLNKEKLSPERIRLLDSLNFSWDPFTELWNEAFAALKEFHKREGHCDVPHKHIEKGLKIGVWIVTQRLRKNNKKLSMERIKSLDSLNFNWDPYTEQWNEAFAALKQFYKREGHFNAPYKHKENGIKLRSWIDRQKDKNNLNDYQIALLNELNFNWD
jgi:superfamily II DNA or RNA helicase